jgi:hypothetical protein
MWSLHSKEINFNEVVAECNLLYISINIININVIQVAQSVQCLATGWIRGSIPGRGERIFPLACVSRPALGPTQSPVQRVPGILSPGLKRGRGVTLTSHPASNT